jgi:hypothetical protein
MGRLMPHKPQNTQSLKKAFDHYRNTDHKAFRHKKTTHHYPNGRKTGCDNIITQEYRDGWDRIFGAGAASTAAAGHQSSSADAVSGSVEPNDFDAAAPTTKGKRK